MRGFFLAFLATFCGCFCFYTLPDTIAAQLGRVMPIWFYEGQVRGVGGMVGVGVGGGWGGADKASIGRVAGVGLTRLA